MNDTGFAMVISNIRIPAELLPFQVEPRVKISAAGMFEQSQFHRVLARGGYFSGFVGPLPSVPVMSNLDDGGVRIAYVPVPDSVMYMVDFSGFNGHLENLKFAGLLVFPKFRFAMESLYVSDVDRNAVSIGGVFSYHQLELMRSCNATSATMFEKDNLLALKHYHGMISAGFKEGARVGRALSLYAETERLSNSSVLLTLSFFSILESLVTNGRIDGESITNQLRHKLNLILRRVTKAPDGAAMFPALSYEKLWAKLYGLRSDIAHGNVYDFKGKYQALTSLELVNQYLDGVVAAVIRLAIDEPALVDDLRSC